MAVPEAFTLAQYRNLRRLRFDFPQETGRAQHTVQPKPEIVKRGWFLNEALSPKSVADLVVLKELQKM